SQKVFDVTDPKNGGSRGANADITQGFLNSWKKACESTTPSKVLVPKGYYMLGEVKIEGPCKAPVELSLQGTVKAPPDPKVFKSDGWITIDHVSQLTVSGGGTFDGQGKLSWNVDQCKKKFNCSFPANVRFNFVDNSTVSHIRSLNSKNIHITVLGCNNFIFQNIYVIAPGTSFNTDGIHMVQSYNVSVLDSTIMTGDDCISVVDGTRNATVERVNCGPGHGISIGSLGRTQNEQPVVGFTVKNCTFTGTLNGVRIKTLPTPKTGVVTDIHYEDLIMNDVSNPILIDQEYCPLNLCDRSTPSRIKISNVRIKNVTGTSATQVAVKISCSKASPCEDVEIGDINLTYSGPGGRATSECANVQPKFSGKQNPPVCAARTVSS
ncbi:Polygalacturonase, partial [Bertholletia excelsa]